MNAMNLDDAEERKAFISQFGTLKGRSLANRLRLKGKGAARLATAISCYAWNAETAFSCRLRGEMDAALMYEGICDRIYNESLAELGWW